MTQVTARKIEQQNFVEYHAIESIGRGLSQDQNTDHVKRAVELLSHANDILGAGNLALVSSFGAEAAVLLHLVSRVNKNFPVLFLETGKHFKETLEYVDMLTARLRLTNVQFISPNVQDVQDLDPNGDLHASNPDKCCAIRKVKPLAVTLKQYQGWITGRKKFHGGGREELELVEWSNGQIKLNPLLDWDYDQIQDHFTNFGLPRHKLTEQGYTSIGCETCTQKPEPGADVRSGRWQGKSKFECGIHLDAGANI